MTTPYSSSDVWCVRRDSEAAQAWRHHDETSSLPALPFEYIHIKYILFILYIIHNGNTMELPCSFHNRFILWVLSKHRTNISGISEYWANTDPSCNQGIPGVSRGRVCRQPGVTNRRCDTNCLMHRCPAGETALWRSMETWTWCHSLAEILTCSSLVKLENLLALLCSSHRFLVVVCSCLIC